MNDTLTSLIIREVTILSKSFGQLSRNCWELSRVLLRSLEEYDKMTINKGESGAEPNGGADPHPPQGSLFDDPRTDAEML